MNTVGGDSRSGASLVQGRHLSLALFDAEGESRVFDGLERVTEVVALEFVGRRCGEGALDR